MPTDCAEDNRAVVFDIQRGSIVDGPGIRTTVFIKGCPLSCRWCHNPEALNSAPQTVVTESGKSKTYGEWKSVEQLMEVILKDRSFYEDSQGGLTISGGEPMSSFSFTHQLAAMVAEEGISVALDSTGFGTKSQWEALLPSIDLFLFDYKLTDPEAHKHFTGVDSTPLHDNIRHVAELGGKILLRCPIIPDINDNPAHFTGILKMANSIQNLAGIDILPYHSMAKYKYEQLGIRNLDKVREPSEEDVDNWMRFLLTDKNTHRIHVRGF